MEKIGNALSIQRGKYAFVYLVGVDKVHRRVIREYCDREQIKLISIPHAQGHYKRKMKNLHI
ncbi:hypothetical protein [[Clostridium] hylemonae]|uniref:hypothetical protein n=1 Tax=[Clostridium] hylemonae TaxID=89153 RepID=UPI0011EC0713|nr:hypothetical protein [[Clostridium] hylemonae]